VSRLPPLSDVRARLLAVVRRGPRTVLWAEPRLGLGNYMYHWLQVHKLRDSGEQAAVLRLAEMEPWLPWFPEIDRDYTVAREDVGLTDVRELGFYQEWGVHYLPEHVERFADFCLAQTTLPLVPEADEERVVLNVRRGDFFEPHFARRFAFDQVTYLRTAVARAARVGAPVRRIHVVSDDVAWCRASLAWLSDDAEVTFAASESTPAEDFATLVGARRLILTNSTFGYWAAHLSNSLHRDNHQDVVVPWFHDRTIWSGASYHLNPAWTVVRDIPGGWDAPEGPRA
jgi:hypothetical protein